MKQKSNGTIQLALAGLMAAMVFAGSLIQIPIGPSRVHLGNSMILLAGFLLGPVPGGLAGGIGSLLFDIILYGSDPLTCLVTFVSKFLMGFIAGLLFAAKNGRKLTGAKEIGRLVLAGVLGEAAYIVIYLAEVFVKFHYINGTTAEAAMAAVAGSLAASLFNAVTAVVISCILYKALKIPVQRVLR